MRIIVTGATGNVGTSTVAALGRDERVDSVVGIARATSDAYPDPADKTGKSHVVDLAPVKKLARPVKLAEVKADKRFADFPLVRIARLSVMPVTDRQWQWILEMSAAGAGADRKRRT